MTASRFGFSASARFTGLTLCLVAGVPITGQAQNWGGMAMISETLGVSDSRICIGEASRGDIGCPGYAPTISPTGRVNMTAGLTVDSVSLTTLGTTWGYLGSTASYVPNFSSNLISATNISATALTVNGVAVTGGGGGSGDRLVSGSLLVVANSNTSIVSLSTGLTTWGYLGSVASYLPQLTSLRVSATAISTTALQLIVTSASQPSGYQGGIWSLSGTQAYYNGGNVGVGTASPGAKFEVVGTISATALTVNGVAVTGGGGGGGGSSLTCPSGYLAITGNTSNGFNDFCISSSSYGPATFSGAQDDCVSRDSQICSINELRNASRSSSWPAYYYFQGGWSSTYSASTVYPNGVESSNLQFHTCASGSAPISGGCTTAKVASNNSQNYYCCRR